MVSMMLSEISQKEKYRYRMICLLPMQDGGRDKGIDG